MFNGLSVPRTTGWRRRKAEALRLETEKAKAQGHPLRKCSWPIDAKSLVNHRTKRLATHSTTVKRTGPMKRVRSPKASG